MRVEKARVKKVERKKVSEEVEREKARKKVESKKKWGKKMGPNVVEVFCFFSFFWSLFFLIILKNNKLALRKLKTTIFFIK